MLRGMSWEGFLGWFAYDQIEPFSEKRADLRAASICSLLANIHRDARRKPRPFTIDDFVLVFGDEVKKEAPKQTWQQQKAIAHLWVAALSGSKAKSKKEAA